MIETRLIRPCAEFLLEHREEQFHNHQCWIAAAISILGITLGDDAIIRAGTQDRWGLFDQLARGTLKDGLWCELTPTYHFYAFDAFASFARYDVPVAHEFRQHPAFKGMPLAGLKLLLPDHTFPLLNDTTPPLNINDTGKGGYGLEHIVPRLEIAAGWWHNPAYHWALSEYYSDHPRASLNALLYGPDRIVPALRPAFLNEDYFSESSGIALLRRVPPPLGYVLVKNSPDGGEHDHRDRPGLYMGWADGKRLTPDLGTVPYTLPLHYGWFKTSIAHNIVILNGENQPPPSVHDIQLSRNAEEICISTRVAWTSNGSPYAGVTYKRVILVQGSRIYDHFTVESPRPVIMDYAMHLVGVTSRMPDEGIELEDTLYTVFKEMMLLPKPSNRRGSFLRLTTVGGNIRLFVAHADGQQQIIAHAPDNPFLGREPLTMWLVRINAATHTFYHVWDFSTR